MKFQLPAGLPPDAARELERACVAGGPDGMPWPTLVRLAAGELSVRRDVDESGALVVPWEVGGAGRLMGSTGTLIERDAPYDLQIELARGKVHQLRSLAADWEAGGLQIPAPLAQQIRQIGVAFGRSVTRPADQARPEAAAALQAAYRSAGDLARLYTDQMFRARHQRQPRLDSTLGCRLSASELREDEAAELKRACNGVALPFYWGEIEPAESDYRWEPYDAHLAWAEAAGLAVVGGPLIDFSAARLPDWLWLWERDLSGLASFMCDYVETAVKRYRGRIRSWQLTAASNWASVLALGEDELLWLTVRLVEAARQIDPKLELTVGIAQPWGEYMAAEDRTHSPFIFADTLIRSGLNLAALDLELVMGVTGRGSYCRDLMEVSRLVDLYSVLQLPLRLTLGFPSSDELDPNANPDFQPAAGRWGDGFSPAAQADWAGLVGALVLCKPTVRSAHWVHPCDADPHLFPNCGLFDGYHRPKPVLARLRQLREGHPR